MRVGYCKVYSSCFRTFGAKVLEIFVLMIRQFHSNESSWNVRSRGTKVPQERKFQGANVPWSESSLYGLFAPGNESAEERKGLESHTHTHNNASTYYAIDNETIGQRNTTLSAKPGIEPRVVSTWVNHVTNMPRGIYHECMALDVVFIGACNG